MKHTILIITTIFIISNLYSQNQTLPTVDLSKFNAKDKNNLHICLTNLNKYQEIQNFKMVSQNSNIIAKILWTNKDYNKAISFYEISIDANQKLKNHNAIACIETYKGSIYADKKEYKKSIECFEQAFLYYKKRRMRKNMIDIRKNMSLSYENMKNIKDAANQMELAFNMAQELNDVQEIIDCSGMLAHFYTKAGNKGKTDFYFKIFKSFSDSKNRELNDSLGRLKTQRTLNVEIQKRKDLELYKKEQESFLKDKIILSKDSTYNELSKKYSAQEMIARLNEQTIKQKETIIKQKEYYLKIITIALIIAVFLILVIAFFYRKTLILKNKISIVNAELKNANQVLTSQKEEIMAQKEEIQSQRDEIKRQRDHVISQKDKITEQNIQIKDSIHYAKKIQTAIFPQSSKLIKNLFPKSFILFKPRDIVSGDFYWVSKIKDKIIIAVADCTGHGVPGAFMSMIGALFLNEIVNNQSISKPSEILNQLRTKIKVSLNQTGKYQEAKDGMDISLISIDKNKMELEYAGAFNPLFIYRNEQLEVIKGDRMPIGIYAIEEEFKNHTIKINPKDKLYMFSDGYADQTGGSLGRKFMTKRFREMITKNAEKDMNAQKEQYLSVIERWMAFKTNYYKSSHEQVDDILVLGIEI